MKKLHNALIEWYEFVSRYGVKSECHIIYSSYYYVNKYGELQVHYSYIFARGSREYLSKYGDIIL